MMMENSLELSMSGSAGDIKKCWGLLIYTHKEIKESITLTGFW